MSHVSKGLDKYLCNYDNILILGEVNASMSNETLKDFGEMYSLKNLITEPTCYKNPNNPSSIDVILTNRVNSFYNSTVIETGLSDHHKMTLTVLKACVPKKEPVTVNYRSYKKFVEESFKNYLINNLQNFDKTVMSYDKFNEIFMNVLHIHAPLKKKTIRGNHAPFMNKSLSKAFMERSRLKNKFNKHPTDLNRQLYNKKRNFCVSLVKKEKRKYYNSLDLTIFQDNRKFWKRVKPLFSDKQKSLERDIILIEDETVTSNKKEVAEKLNNFFTEAVAKLEIEPYLPVSTNTPICNNIHEIIEKYKYHPSITKIKEKVGECNKFHFMDVSSQVFEKEIKRF